MPKIFKRHKIDVEKFDGFFKNKMGEKGFVRISTYLRSINYLSFYQDKARGKISEQTKRNLEKKKFDVDSFIIE